MLILRKAFDYLFRSRVATNNAALALQATILHRVLIVLGSSLILVGAVIPLIAYAVYDSEIAVATLLAILIVVFVILKRGYIDLAARILVFFCWLCAVGFIAISGGMRSSGSVYLLAAIALSGLLLSDQAMARIALASVAAATVMFGAELLNVEFPRVFRITGATGWIAFSLSALATMALVRYTISGLKNALNQSAQQIALRLQAQTELEYLAVTDELTGLFNRRHFFERVERMLALAIQEKSALALLMIDADHFKIINDTYGHAMGDHVLKHVAGVLSSRVRTSDVLARYGGEEFILYLKDVSPQAAFALAERMRFQLGESAYRIGDESISLTISIGITICNTATAAPALDDLIARADRALYAAKQNGRNCCVLE